MWQAGSEDEDGVAPLPKCIILCPPLELKDARHLYLVLELCTGQLVSELLGAPPPSEGAGATCAAGAGGIGGGGGGGGAGDWRSHRGRPLPEAHVAWVVG